VRSVRDASESLSTLYPSHADGISESVGLHPANLDTLPGSEVEASNNEETGSTGEDAFRLLPEDANLCAGLKKPVSRAADPQTKEAKKPRATFISSFAVRSA